MITLGQERERDDTGSYAVVRCHGKVARHRGGKLAACTLLARFYPEQAGQALLDQHAEIAALRADVAALRVALASAGPLVTMSEGQAAEQGEGA